MMYRTERHLERRTPPGAQRRRSGAQRRTFTPFALLPCLYLVLAVTRTGGCAPGAARRPGTPERASPSLPQKHVRGEDR